MIKSAFLKIFKGKNTSNLYGFTLIEVTIVLFIIALMTSASIPWMKTFAETTKLKSSARGIRDVLEFARASAVTERVEYIVAFDLQNAQYLLAPKEAMNTETDGTVILSSINDISTNYANLLSEETENKRNTTQVYAGRGSGIVGVINQVSENIQIAEIISDRNTNGGANLDYITFYPDSTAEDFDIYLQGTSGKTFVVRVAESTGRASIKQLTDEETELIGLNIKQNK
ncbi:TPA: prepilin-type N-terminal cleavage/methylation domain-containing protein [bacterium]|nr:prepilin-type N-terminal cleavage/methylation domain-containing protein [bacterium]